MFTKKDIIYIILFVIGAAAVFMLVIWLITEIAPILIGGIVFVPWLFAALNDGGNV